MSVYSDRYRGTPNELSQILAADLLTRPACLKTGPKLLVYFFASRTIADSSTRLLFE